MRGELFSDCEFAKLRDRERKPSTENYYRLRGRAAKCSQGWHGWRRRLPCPVGSSPTGGAIFFEKNLVKSTTFRARRSRTVSRVFTQDSRRTAGFSDALSKSASAGAARPIRGILLSLITFGRVERPFFYERAAPARIRSTTFNE